MVNKKYLLLAGFMSACAAQPVLAQESGNQAGSSKYANRDMTYRGDNYDVLDSAYIPKSRMAQQRKYLNHQYNFPAKPNSQWEVGINGGLFNIIGDVPSKNPFNAKKFTDAVGYGVTVRKAIGYVFSLRLQFLHGVGSGFDYRSSTPNEIPWINSYAVPNQATTTPIFHNYRTTYNELSLQMVAATNNIRFHKSKNTFSLYGFLGIGGASYNAKVNAKNGSNNYDYSVLNNAVAGTYNPAYLTSVKEGDKKKVNDAMKNLLDDSYESDGPNGGSKTIMVVSAGFGGQFRLSKLLTLQLEEKFAFTGNDLLDAKQLQNNGSITPDKDLVNYASVGLNFNIGNKNKNVAPLWWINPLDHAYGELADPRHMRLPEPILSDADGDGIADQFDKCPGTPSGVAVDSHGCPMDSDGDGVPDDRDKELITPTECQPVDADGVGKCPCHCATVQGPTCNIMAGTINFAGSSTKISAAMQAQLATLAAQMTAGPTCKVVLIGQGNTSKLQQQRSWDRVNAIQEYMSEKHGIDRSRFIFQYGQPGDPNSVMYRIAQQGEDGPSTVAPPHPQLSNQK